MRDPALGALSKEDAIGFRNQLQAWAIKEGKTARTADTALVSVRAPVSVARDAGWIPVNPFERLTVGEGGKESEGREPWMRISANVTAHFGHRDRRRYCASMRSFRSRDRPFRRS